MGFLLFFLCGPLQSKNDLSKEIRKREEELKSRLIKHPIIPYYTNMPPPNIRKSLTLTTEQINEAELMPGFSEFRKYKKVNETRTITPYRKEISQKRRSISNEAIPPIIQVKDPIKFFLDRKYETQITNLESLVKMVESQPDIGYVTMKRDHMDMLNDYNPYSFIICHYNDVDKSNYVTISPYGLIEFYKDDADFLALDRLQPEQKMFCVLKQIPSFQLFRIWKAFMVWFKKPRCKRFIEARDKIEMFFAAKYSSKALAQ